jgi:hypothetical protein
MYVMWNMHGKLTITIQLLQYNYLQYNYLQYNYYNTINITLIRDLTLSTKCELTTNNMPNNWYNKAVNL